MLLDFPFNSGSSGVGYYVQDADNTAPVSPSGVARSTIRAGQATGGSQLGSGLAASREIFMGIMWRTNAEFGGRTAKDKMFFIRGGQSNGFFGMMQCPGCPQRQFGFGINAPPSILDDRHTCGDDGLWCYPNALPTSITIGKWTKIEVYVRGSTTSTSRDGVVRWFIDGVMNGNYTNMNITPELFNEWFWTETWDGCGGNANCDLGRVNTTDWSHYIDHIYISAPSCGAGGCPPPAYLLITSSLSSARTGTPYTATLAADGGTKPYTWFLQSGNLPSGLTLNGKTGVISGTPTCVGRSDFTIRVADASSPALSATKSYSIISSGTGVPCSSTPIARTETKVEQEQFSAKAVAGKMIFNLPVASSAQYRLSIYDLAGKKVYEHASMGQKEISIARTLKNGVYVARFAQGMQSNAVRFQVMD